MKLKILTLFFISLVLISCAGIGSGSNAAQDSFFNGQWSVNTPMLTHHDTGSWISGPLEGQFIIIGVSGRLLRHNDEIEAAKLDAARKASMYHFIQGSIEMTNTEGSRGFFDYSTNTRLELNYDQNLENYINRLSFDPQTDVLRGNGATYVRFRFDIRSDNLNYIPERTTSRPVWVNNRNLPQFEGFTTVVGFAGRRTRLRDTINASMDSAAARLIETASYINETREIVIDGSQFSSTVVRSEGRLSNFQVLAFWIDPDSRAVSTLAIARVLN